MNTPKSFRAAPLRGQYLRPGKAGCAAVRVGRHFVPSRSVGEEWI